MQDKLIFAFKLFWQTTKSNPAILVCLVAAAVARMHTNVTQSFQQLWVYEFFSKDQTTEASDLYSYISIACDIVQIGCIFFVGRLVDKLPPKIIIPISFVVNGAILMLF